MPDRYVTAADFDAICDARTTLFSTDGTAANYSDTLFNRAAEFASNLAKKAAKNAGHDLAADTDGSVSSDDIKTIALGALVGIAYGRKQKTVPQATQDILGQMLEATRLGELPLTGLNAEELEAIGAVKWTDTSTTSSTGRPPIFRNLRNVL